jgi:hypothetical protein
MHAALARTAEWQRGRTIVRELHARDVAGEPAADIEAAKQLLWYACQTTSDRRGAIVVVEQRHFVTSIPTRPLTRGEELALIRMPTLSRERAKNRAARARPDRNT